MTERHVPLITWVTVAALLSAASYSYGQVVDRASVDSGGAQAVGGDASRCSISTDGRFVAFESAATNLVPGDTNGTRDVFVHDRTTDVTTRVSVDSAGAQAVGGGFGSSEPSISADGRFVAFDSDATNLVAGDTNASFDTFVHDRVTGATTRVSVDSAGAQADTGSFFEPSISADGRFVAFASSATNLVAGDTNGLTDIFVHDRTTGATTRVSVDSAGMQAIGGFSIEPSISADGQLVAFDSTVTNLVAGDTNGVQDVFVHDRTTGATTRVSVDSTGAQSVAGNSAEPSISPDGRFVTFQSGATNLVAGDTNALFDTFVHDRTTSATTRVSVDSAGIQATGGNSQRATFSSDGRFVAFESAATNLVPGDTNAVGDIFVHDQTTGATARASIDSAGTQAVGGVSGLPTISSDGRFVAFISFATNLVPGDTNAQSDIFVAINPLFPAAVARLFCADPIGVSSSGGDRVRLRGTNLHTVQAVNLGASFPTADGAGTDLAILGTEEIEFTMPALAPGQKFIEVVAASNSDEIRDAITVSGTGGSSSAVVEGGSTPEAYRMRSVPLFQNFGSVFGQLTACLGPADPRVWRGFFWDPQLQQYAEIQGLLPRRASDSFAGRGIFLISRETKDCGFNGLSTEPATNFYLCLEPGWNMVSLPSSGSLSWSAVTVGTKGRGSTGADDVPASAPNPFIAEFLYAWDGTQYMSASALVEGEAYWAYNKTAGLVVLFANDPAPKSGAAPGQVLSDLPAGAPSPPPPPETYDAGVSGTPASGGGAGGGGGGDSATQVGLGGTPLLLVMSVVLVAMAVSGRNRV